MFHQPSSCKNSPSNGGQSHKFDIDKEIERKDEEWDRASQAINRIKEGSTGLSQEEAASRLSELLVQQSHCDGYGLKLNLLDDLTYRGHKVDDINWTLDILSGYTDLRDIPRLKDILNAHKRQSHNHSGQSHDGANRPEEDETIDKQSWEQAIGRLDNEDTAHDIFVDITSAIIFNTAGDGDPVENAKFLADLATRFSSKFRQMRSSHD